MRYNIYYCCPQCNTPNPDKGTPRKKPDSTAPAEDGDGVVHGQQETDRGESSRPGSPGDTARQHDQQATLYDQGADEALKKQLEKIEALTMAERARESALKREQKLKEAQMELASLRTYIGRVGVQLESTKI